MKKKPSRMEPLEFIKYLNGRRGWHGNQYRTLCGQWLESFIGTNGPPPESTDSTSPPKSGVSSAENTDTESCLLRTLEEKLHGKPGGIHGQTPTPETDAEMKRDAYAAEIRRFLDEATDFSESRRDFLRFLRLADDIDERFPEFRK